jgi:hypothetical protein
VRASLAQASTTAELNAAASAEAKRITGRDVKFDMAGSDVQVAREHAEGILHGLQKYPSTDVEFVGTYGPNSNAPKMLELTLHSDSYAVTMGSSIYFNNKFGANESSYRNALTREPPTRSQIPRDPRGVALHEFGHRVSEYGMAEGAAGVTAERSAAKAHETPASHVTQHVSLYATSSDHELAAEAFADVMLNGSAASALSSSIVSVLQESYVFAGGKLGGEG